MTTKTADPWIWLEGLSETSDGTELWMPLYCFRRDTALGRARATLSHVLKMDELPRELACFQDFRLSGDALEEPESPDRPLQAPLKPSGPRSGTSTRQGDSEGSEGRTASRKRCRECFDAKKRNRCIKKGPHDEHRDLNGNRW